MSVQAEIIFKDKSWLLNQFILGCKIFKHLSFIIRVNDIYYYFVKPMGDTFKWLSHIKTNASFQNLYIFVCMH